jgi:hypothetical protein
MVSDPEVKDIKIKTNEDVSLDNKTKAGVKALAKKPVSETSAEYKANSDSLV